MHPKPHIRYSANMYQVYNTLHNHEEEFAKMPPAIESRTQHHCPLAGGKLGNCRLVQMPGLNKKTCKAHQVVCPGCGDVHCKTEECKKCAKTAHFNEEKAAADANDTSDAQTDGNNLSKQEYYATKRAEEKAQAICDAQGLS
jgi:hypothetical protein